MVYQDRLETNLLQLFTYQEISEWLSITFSYYFYGQNWREEHANTAIIAITCAVLHWTQISSFLLEARKTKQYFKT